MNLTETLYLQFLITAVGGLTLLSMASPAGVELAAVSALVLLAAAVASIVLWTFLHAHARFVARQSEESDPA